MTPLSYRPATRSDIAQVLANETAAYVIPWSQQSIIDSLQSNYVFWVVLHQRRIVGHIIFQSVADECHLLNICLNPHHQGQGLGQSMLQHWLEYCESHELTQLFLEVRVSNSRALKLYQNNGFKIVSRRKDYYRLPNNQREDGILMLRQLTPR